MRWKCGGVFAPRWGLDVGGGLESSYEPLASALAIAH